MPGEIAKRSVLAWLVAGWVVSLGGAVATQEQLYAPVVTQDGRVYEAGNGVSSPRVIKSVSPKYTEAAKAAQITGVVQLKAVVEVNGRVNRVGVTKSLDKKYGLDDQAVKAARQWRFEPAKKDRKPVAVWISIQMEFKL